MVLSPFLVGKVDVGYQAYVVTWDIYIHVYIYIRTHTLYHVFFIS